MIILNYSSKKELKNSVGEQLLYTETSIFNFEYRGDGIVTGSNRPSITGIRDAKGRKAREFFARVTMKNDRIAKVE